MQGETAFSGGKKHIGEQYRLDLVYIPIDGNYTMNAREAVEGSRFFNVCMMFPIHFGPSPFSPIQQRSSWNS